MAGTPRTNNNRTDSRKPRKLTLESLEDRSVPAAFASYDAPLSTVDPTGIAVVRVATTLAMSASATTSHGTSPGKLAANHNQTLVRDRRRRKSRRG